MNKEELIKEIKKSRKQNTNERYEYINSHFNQTNYAISLEKYVKELLKENKERHNKIDKAIELNGEIDKSLRMKNTNAYIELEDMIFEQWKILKDSDVDGK